MDFAADVYLSEAPFPPRFLFGALIKKKIKFSSYIGKFRMEQLQSHI